MPEDNERPRPHGDPLEELIDQSPEENQAQANSDAAPDASGDRSTNSDRADGHGSDANGLAASDEAAGEERKKLYREGASLVSRID
jgi:hypothetical protein